MKSINTQILKPFYIGDFIINSNDNYFVNETERLFKNVPGYINID